MSNSVIDAHTFTVRRSIDIAATIEKVWSAISEPAHISQWFGTAEFEGSGVGAYGTLTFAGYATIPVRVEAYEVNRSITYRWNNDDALGNPPTEVDEATSTTFTFTLESLATGTRLTVVESGFEATSDPAANLEYHRGGWDGELNKLVTLVESAA